MSPSWLSLSQVLFLIITSANVVKIALWRASDSWCTVWSWYPEEDKTTQSHYEFISITLQAKINTNYSFSQHSKLVDRQSYQEGVSCYCPTILMSCSKFIKKHISDFLPTATDTTFTMILRCSSSSCKWQATFVCS